MNVLSVELLEDGVVWCCRHKLASPSGIRVGQFGIVIINGVPVEFLAVYV